MPLYVFICSNHKLTLHAELQEALSSLNAIPLFSDGCWLLDFTENLTEIKSRIERRLAVGDSYIISEAFSPRTEAGGPFFKPEAAVTYTLKNCQRDLPVKSEH